MARADPANTPATLRLELDNGDVHRIILGRRWHACAAGFAYDGPVAFHVNAPRTGATATGLWLEFAAGTEVRVPLEGGPHTLAGPGVTFDVRPLIVGLDPAVHGH